MMRRVPRVLVTGASGLLGGRVADLLVADVVRAVHETAPGEPGPTVELDLERDDSTSSAIERARAEAVVHCAALADVDACEREPERAERVNASGTDVLARAAARAGARFVYVSTDLVLDGTEVPAREDAPTASSLVYARTKRAGELAALAAGGVVVRVPLIVGRGHGPRGTASEAIAWALAEGTPPRLYTDQFRTPTDAESVTLAIGRLVESAHTGVFHLGGPESISRHALGRRVARALGLDPERVVPVTQAEAPAGAPRPADVSLDSTRSRRELGYAPRELDVSIAESRPRPPAAG
jgi:dTDP-4-dehydrorhamnose reductase